VMALFFVWHLVVSVPYNLWKEQYEKINPNHEYDREWDRLNALDREREESPFITALKRDWTDRTAAAMAKAREPKRDTSVIEALAYIAFHRWGGDSNDALLAVFDESSDPIREFRQAARDGEITVWGRQRSNRVYDKIPLDHWSKHGLDGKALMHGTAATRWTDIHGSADEEYHGLMVSKAEIERHWPSR